MSNTIDNGSTLKGYRYSADYSGEEFFLKDHQVKGRRILPGVCHIEMARAAVTQEKELSEHDQAVMVLRQIVWAKPVVANAEGVQVHLDLYPEPTGSVRYEIGTADGANENTDVAVCSWGSASIEMAVETPRIDIPRLQAGCSGQVSGETCYKVTEEEGLNYGPAFRGIVKVQEAEGYVLGCLKLPLSVTDTLDDYMVHPSMLDSALQSSIVLMGQGQEQLYLPFAVDEVRIYGGCSENMWSYARYSEGSVPSDATQRLDIDLADEEGITRVQIRGIVFRALKKTTPGDTRKISQNAPSPITGDVGKVSQSSVSDWLKILVSEELQLPVSELDIDIPFQEYGVDSLLLARIAKRIDAQLQGVNISPTIILENPTIRMLSDHFKDHYATELSALLKVDVVSDAPDAPPTDPDPYTRSPIGPSPYTGSSDAPLPYTRSSKGKTPAPSAFSKNSPIAVIGMACHFPDAHNIAEYWKNLKEGKDSIREVPEDRWDIRLHYTREGQQPGKAISKWGAFLDNIEDFDPGYFGIDPALASQIDPLERQWLEVSAEAIADAGYKKEDLWGKRAGVYAGSRPGNFSDKIGVAHKDILVGVSQNFIAAHLAHIYNLQGPNMVIDTACSSSITAIDLAVKDLRLGTTEIALAGGVDILLDEKTFIGLSTAGVLSPQGKSKTFDAEADGIGLGEGCGVLVLRRLEDAIAAGDKIYGVIEGTSVNNDGNTMGITTPNPKAQHSLIADAVRNAGIDVSTISYIETHGTGTLIGDPIELKAITGILEAHTREKGTCGVGSVKSNIGHLLAAAGIAGVIKTLLSMTAKQIPPTLHCNTPNPRFDFANSPVYPVTKLQQWDGIGGVRRAGVSAFGLGGSNAHVIISDAGIPEASRVQLPFALPAVRYRRSRYWPEGDQQLVQEPAKPRPQGIAPVATDQRMATVTTDQHVAPVTINNGIGAIIDYLKGLVGAKLDLPVSEIDDTTGFYELGLDSTIALDLVKDLETKCGHDFYPTLLFEYQTIKDLSEYLSEKDGAHFQANLTPTPTPIPPPPPRSPRQSPEASALPVSSSTGANPSSTGPSEEPIAIIGVSGRYPGARNINELWEHLRQGKSCITEVPKDRWDVDKEYNEGRSKGKWGGFLQDVDKFDPLHFNLSPEMAEMLDPQIRLFMEIVWATFEDAGYTPRTHLDTRIGVFVGSMFHEYPVIATDKYMSDQLSFTTSWAIANRISYHFGLSGPSIAVNTASSSSLTAVVQACDSIRKGDCSEAIAGGVNLTLHPSKWRTLGEYGLLGSTRSSKIFGDGDGYISGEGVGAVLLKSLSAAVKDGDQIYGVIISSALNHNGSTSGFGVPNPNAQSLLMTDSLERSGIDPATISYVEAAANGSPIGDPIEIAGLSRVFSKTAGREITIGSVKSNIGHCEAASGISQLTKVLLQLRHNQFVPGINLENLNANLHLERTPFKFCNALTDWKPNGPTRRAMISSFGAGGSNAHLVIEEYLPEHKEHYTSGAPAIIVMSARDADRLREQAANLKAYMTSTPDIDLSDIAYTLQVGREPMEERLALVAKDKEQLAAELGIYLEGKTGSFLTGNIRKDKIDMLIKGKAGEAYIREALKEKELDSLAQLWVKGARIDWNTLYPANRPNRISMPTYPFARERYWIPGQVNRGGHTPRTGQTETDTPAAMTGRAAIATPAAINGQTATAMQSAMTRHAEIAPPAPINGRAEKISMHLYSSNWQELPLAEAIHQEPPSARLILLAGGTTVLADKLAEQLDTTVEALPQLTTEAYFIHVLGKMKEKAAERAATQIIVVCRNAEYMDYGFIAGLLKTAAREHPKISGKIIGVDDLSLTVLETLTEMLQAEQHTVATEVRYKDGIRAVKTFQEIEHSSTRAGQMTIKEGGVYLVTGGAGGLGRIFAAHISKTKDTRLILTGRSDLSRAGKNALAKIPNAEYQRCDVSNKEEVMTLIQTIKRTYQKLDGIIHSAGVLRDSYILKKTAAEAGEVLSAKIQGARNLDEATKKEKLDFMVFFSSVSGVLGNPGQADYAAANAYLDNFAHYRNEEKAKGKRQGKTISIDWPLWKDGGMQIPGETLKHLEKQWGIQPLTTREGVRAFEELLNGTASQGIVAFGNHKLMAGLFTNSHNAKVPI